MHCCRFNEPYSPPIFIWHCVWHPAYLGASMSVHTAPFDQRLLHTISAPGSSHRAQHTTTFGPPWFELLLLRPLYLCHHTSKPCAISTVTPCWTTVGQPHLFPHVTQIEVHGTGWDSGLKVLPPQSARNNRDRYAQHRETDWARQDAKTLGWDESMPYGHSSAGVRHVMKPRHMDMMQFHKKMCGVCPQGEGGHCNIYTGGCTESVRATSMVKVTSSGYRKAS